MKQGGVTRHVCMEMKEVRAAMERRDNDEIGTRQGDMIEEEEWVYI